MHQRGCVWFVKRRPTRRSYFRDAFPYLEHDLGHGMVWVRTRHEAARFDSLKKAREALRRAKRLDKDIVIVRVKEVSG